jgi:hypothetical protein
LKAGAEISSFCGRIDGHFVGFEPIVCADDTGAIERAKRLLDGRDIEVWCGPRLVARLPQKTPPEMEHYVFITN